MQVRLSIVLPVLNEAALIRTALLALAPWRAAGVQVLVVDGGSSDDTAAQCAGLADRVLIAATGRARQMNAGAAASSASMLLFLHADTRLPAAAVQRVMDALASRQWGRFDVRIDGGSAMFPVIAALMNARSRITGIATGDQALFMRREAFDAVGGFPEQPLMEDIEMSRRLLRLGRPACLHYKVVTSGRRWEQKGVWRTIALMWRLRWLYWRGEPAERLATLYR